MCTTRTLVRAFAVFALPLGLCKTASAQSALTPVEVGGGLAGIVLENDEVGARFSPGINARLDLNMTRRLALEARATWFPRQESIRYQFQGGRTFHLAAGVRAVFVEGRRFSLYGVL